MSTDCFICQKHQDLNNYTGEILLEKNGMILTHFAIFQGAPATKGHLLIEPTRHITDPSEMTEEEASALGSLISQGTNLIKTKLGAEHVYLFRINDLVAHLHFHLVPRYPNTPKDYWGLKIMVWPDRPQIELPEIQELSKKLKL